MKAQIACTEGKQSVTREKVRSKDVVATKDEFNERRVGKHPPFIRHFTKSLPCYRTGSYYLFDVISLFLEISIEHLQRMRLANRRRLLLRTPGPFPFGTCSFRICSDAENIHS